MSKINDNSLPYSDDALSIRHAFFNKQFVIYVEGVDDIPFWDACFSKFLPSSLEKGFVIEDVGGKERLLEYVEGVKNGTLTNIVVACDSDYDYSFGGQVPHVCVVRTFGHSIENTMFCPKSLVTYLKRIVRTINDLSSCVFEWLEKFVLDASQLLPYEIENSINPEHSEELPKIFNLGFFQLSENGAIDLSTQKISSLLTKISPKYSEEKIAFLSEQIKNSDIDNRFYIQGHFYASTVMNFIRIKGNKLSKQKIGSLSKEALYAYFCDCNQSCSPICDDMSFIKNQILQVGRIYDEKK